jgi:hypothetical protein
MSLTNNDTEPVLQKVWPILLEKTKPIPSIMSMAQMLPSGKKWSNYIFWYSMCPKDNERPNLK